MGNRLSGTLAIICMDRFEHTHIYTTYQPARLLLRPVCRWYWNFREQCGGSRTDVDWPELETPNNSIRTRDTKWGQVLTHPWPHDKSQQRGPSWAETLLQASKQRNHTQLFFPSTLDYKKSNGECGTTSSWNLSDLRIRSNCGEPHWPKSAWTTVTRLPGPVLHVHGRTKRSVQTKNHFSPWRFPSCQTASITRYGKS